ncbi:hypothetical protein NDN08_005234 [Rhodosorus marinus]|uniref:Pentacotripeptide-repeat region of PRORP domain-containing protein n=1 Tax=Rhodosorus marinus TaxID=101924 RepID=A0AAV8V131_9RHOD|nr:hypothetical protein NDN08_005234 [Rhodosorus marinus]
MVFDYEDMVERSQARKDITMFVFNKLLETGAPTRLLPMVISASEQIVSEREADKHKILLTMKEAAEKGEIGSALNQSLELRSFRMGIEVCVTEKRFLCLAQAKTGNIEAAIAELEYARAELKEEPDEEFYAIIADHKNDMLWLATARELMSQRSVPIGKKFLQVQMQVLLRHSKLREVHKALNQIAWSEFQDPVGLSLHLITAYGKQGKASKARSVVMSGKCGKRLEKTAQIRRALFRAYCLANDLKLARRELRNLRRKFPDTTSDSQSGKDCAFLIKALVRANLHEEAEEHFSMWMREKVSDRRRSEPFHAMLETYAYDGKVQAVKVILRLMKMQMISDASWHDDWYLALAHLEQNEPLKAARIVDGLSKMKSPVSASLARRIFFALARNCEPEDCERFQYSQELFTDRNIWNGVLISWAKQGCERNIARVLKAMDSRGIKPNRHTFDCVAGVLERKGANSVKEFMNSELAVQAKEIGLGFKKLENALARRRERVS